MSSSTNENPSPFHAVQKLTPEQITPEQEGAEIARRLLTALASTHTHQENGRHLFEALTDILPAPAWHDIDEALARVEAFCKVYAQGIRSVEASHPAAPAAMPH